MVEQVKSTVWSRFVLQEITDFQPSLSGTVSVCTSLLELLLVELLACQLFQLFDRFVELSANVFNILIMNFYCIVVRDIDHDQRNVTHTSDVLIPFCHTVTDVVAAENEIRLRDLHLTDGRDGLDAALFVRSIRQLFKLQDIYKLQVRSLGLRILFRLSSGLVDDHVAVLIL